MIISLSGFIGSGKDSVAEYLINNHGFVRFSYADALKRAVSVIFGWDYQQLLGQSAESRVWRETVDAWWAQRLSIPHLTPRWVLQNFGTEVCRNNFHPDIWVAAMERDLLNTQESVVITDCRFPNEIQSLSLFDPLKVWVRRDPLPTWYHAAVYHNSNNLPVSHSQSMRVLYPEIHESEWAWVGSNMDYIIHNNGTLEQMFAGVDAILKIFN